MDRNPSHGNVLAVLFDCEEQFALSSTVNNWSRLHTSSVFCQFAKRGKMWKIYYL